MGCNERMGDRGRDPAQHECRGGEMITSTMEWHNLISISLTFITPNILNFAVRKSKQVYDQVETIKLLNSISYIPIHLKN